MQQVTFTRDELLMIAALAGIVCYYAVRFVARRFLPPAPAALLAFLFAGIVMTLLPYTRFTYAALASGLVIFLTDVVALRERVSSASHERRAERSRRA